MSPSGSKTDGLLRLAALRRPHGLEGEISAELLGEFPEMLSPGRRLHWEGRGEGRELEVSTSRAAGPRVLVKFVGWEGLEKAKELCGGTVSVEREAIARPSEDFLFEHEIEGFACVSSGGEPLGRALRFERHGDQVFLEVIRGGRRHLVPYTRPIVVEVDRERRRVVVDPPEGLFEL